MTLISNMGKIKFWLRIDICWLCYNRIMESITYFSRKCKTNVSICKWKNLQDYLSQAGNPIFVNPVERIINCVRQTFKIEWEIQEDKNKNKNKKTTYPETKNQIMYYLSMKETGGMCENLWSLGFPRAYGTDCEW